MSATITRFKYVSIAEGISSALLMGIAMPIKYLAGNPLPVRYTGWAHGILFIAYLFALLEISIKLKWSLKLVAMAFIASLLPAGTFWFDAKYLKNKNGL